jgi:hypothetical protein
MAIEEPETPVKSRYAVPESNLAGDANAGHGELVTMQPTAPPNDWVPSGGADGDGGDGD